MFRLKDGTESMIKVTENLNGKIIEREFCTFNKHRDVRNCWNYDTNTSHSDMQNANGDWYKVADE
jgi:hypothetical protein